MLTFGVSVLAIAGRAQSIYSNAVMSLNPVAYWPLQETNQPPSYDIETNYGSLGAIANMYYASTNAWHSQGGAIDADSDGAIKLTAAAGSFGVVPTTDNRVSLPAGQPFTVECWTRPTSQTFFRGIISQTGPNNAGGLNGVNASYGWELSMGFAAYKGTGTGNNPPGFDFHVFNGNGFTGGAEAIAANTNCWLTGGAIDYTNSWVYLAAVFDGTNAWLYMYSTNMDPSVSGTNQMQYFPQFPITTVAGGGSQNPSLTFLPDTWDPIEFGSERGLGANLYPGYLDEAAVYTNALTTNQIISHFMAGTNGLGNYSTTILADNPYMYWRMDATNWTYPSPGSLPSAVNYGSAAASMMNGNTGGIGANCGVYQPGTVPGVAGPSFGGFGPFTKACAFNGLVGAVDAGYHSLLNPIGANNNFTLVGWFKGNPTDSGNNRNVSQSIVSHNANSWNVTVKSGAITGSKGAGGTPTIAMNTFNANDSNWHMVVLESTYVPGVSTNLTVSLDSGAVSAFVANPSAIPGTNGDVWIGGAPNSAQPTNEATYLAAQQYLAGEVCHVAYFTNALTAAQITALYSAARPEPLIGRQPVSGLAGVGGAYTNSVGASGQQPLVYQWYKDNAPLANQTNASLILNPVQVTDESTNYYVTVTNSFGAVTSAAVSLTVVSNLTIVAQFPVTYTSPITLYGGQVVNGTNYLGSTPTFSVSAVGAVPISYQWRTNGVPVTGATSSSFTFTNCQMDSPTSFDCIMANSYGSLTSMVWGVSYMAAPTAPFPQAVLAAAPVDYWRLNELDDGGFDGNPGAICNDYQAANNGTYTNVYLNNATFGTGYSPATDPTEGAAEFGIFPKNSSTGCAAFAISNVDVSVPLGGNGEFTVAVWANGSTNSISTTQPANAGLVTKGYFNGEEFTLDEGSTIRSTGVRFYVRDALANGYDASSTVLLGNDSNWHFVVGVCDEANGKTSLYVDGVRVGGVAIPSGAGIVNSASVPLMIGARSGSAANPGNNQFRGLLNDVAIYNYAMTADQIASQYQSVGGTIAPYFLPPLPPTNVSVATGTTLSIPITPFGTPPIGYFWTNVTTGDTLSGGTTNGTTLNAGLIYNNVPAAWNGNQLELTVTNAYGTTNLLVTLSVGSTVNTTPTNIVFSVSGGNQLTLTWPGDHTGWRLQSETNLVGSNWTDVANSASTNQIVVPIDLSNRTFFYRLVYP